MPDRALNPDGTVNLDADRETRNDPEAIAACRLCGPDGYRGRMVCDHKPHRRGPGYEAAQAALAEIRHRKVEKARDRLDSDRLRATESDENGLGDHLGEEGLK